MKQIRILLVGDEAVGKTSVIERYMKDRFLLTHTPTVINEYVKYTKNHELHIRDSSGLPEYKQLRFLQYSQVDVILFCFNLALFDSFDNLLLKWEQEVNENCSGVIRILIGCKSDLESIINELLIVKLQDRLKISKYIKCSAKSNENVDAVFDSVINAHQVSKRLPFVRKMSKANKSSKHLF